MTCPTCDKPAADTSRPATLGPGESCECGLRLENDRLRAENDRLRAALAAAEAMVPLPGHFYEEDAAKA